MSDQTGDDVPRDPWGNPLGPEDRAPVDPQPDDFPPLFPSDPPGGSGAPPQWDTPTGPPPATPSVPQEPPFTPPANPAWPGSQPAQPTQPSAVPPPLPPTQPGPGWGGPGVPPQQQPYPPGAAYQGYGQGNPWAPPKNDGMAIGSLVSAIVGLFCCGIVLAPVAVTLGFLSRKRIRESNGALRGDGLAITGIVLGVVGLVLAIVGMIIFIRNPDALKNIFSNLTTTTTGG